MIYFYIFIICLTNLNTSKSAIINLNSNWTLVNRHFNFTVNLVKIPNSVHTILIDNKLIDNPLDGYNDVNLRWIGHDSNWIFQKNIPGPISRSTILIFDSIDTIASIYINGRKLISVNNQFVRHKIENVQNFLQNKNNLLEIRFLSPIEQSLNYSQNYPYKMPPECPPNVQHGECHVNFLRKQQCSFSWDWGPALTPIGLNGPVYLNVLDNFDFDFYASVYSADLLEWTIDIDVNFEFQQPNSDNLDALVEIKISDFDYSESLTIDKSTKKCKLTLNLNSGTHTIDLWWPSGYGKQPLYDLTIQFTDKKTGATNLKSKKVGFRQVELVQDKVTGCQTDGLLFKFRINKLDIFLKGSNWIPADSLQEKITTEYLRWLLESAKLSNMNVLRIWGGGVYESDDFYNLADELGIMIWQDFMFACAAYPTDELFLENVINEVEYQVNRLRHHPSIIVWAANNENEAAISTNWYNTDVNRKLYSDDYRRLYIDTIMRTVFENDYKSSRPFLSSSPTNGIRSMESEDWLATNPYDLRFGDLHYYNYDANGWNEREFPIPRFMSEFGVQSLPSYSTLRQAYNMPEDADMFGTMNQHRQHHENGNEQIINEIKMNLRLPNLPGKVDQFRALIYLSQINQAMTLRTGSELYRRSRSILDTKKCEGLCMGTMYWQFNDLWQAPTWSTIEYTQNYKYGKWKMAHYYIANAYSDIILSSTSNQTHYLIYSVSDMNTTVDSVLNMFVFGYDSLKPRYVVSIRLSVPPYSSKLVYSAELNSFNSLTKCTETESCIIKLVPSSPQIKENFHFLNYKLSAVNNLKKAIVKITDIAKISETGFRISLETDEIALFVWLELETNQIGGYFSDNGFHMTTQTTSVILVTHEKNINLNDLWENLSVQSLMNIY